jgi:hypothetical protein
MNVIRWIAICATVPIGIFLLFGWRPLAMYLGSCAVCLALVILALWLDSRRWKDK